MEDQMATLITLVSEIRDLMAGTQGFCEPAIKPPKQDRLLDDGEVERILKVHNTTLRRYRREGRISSIKIGGKHFTSLLKLEEAFSDSFIKGTFRKLSAEDFS